MKALLLFITTLVLLPAAPILADIIGGSPAGENEWSQVVGVTAIESSSGLNEKIVCSGVLIHPKVVLTAAHCILPGTVSIYLGTGAPGGLIEGQYEIEGLEKYPGWTGYTEQYASFDFGFVVLKKAVHDITPARLYRGDKSANKNLVVVGYGARDNKYIYSGEKYFKEVPYNFYERLKTITLGSVLLPGDSGGPGFVETQNGPELIGINSRIIKRISILETLDDTIQCWIEDRTGIRIDESYPADCKEWDLKKKKFSAWYRRHDQGVSSSLRLGHQLADGPIKLIFQRGLKKLHVDLEVKDQTFTLLSPGMLSCKGKILKINSGPYEPKYKGVCHNKEAYFELESVSRGRLFLKDIKQLWVTPE
jgi:V8-like Glu-specific endopeptidase